MARYIDAVICADIISEKKNISLDDLVDVFAEVPTADVVEVKHGEWIKTDRGIRKSVNTGQSMRVYACDCSCCGYHTGNQGTEFNYCPRCGAKMDGVKEE